jgi:hypothetical protein
LARPARVWPQAGTRVQALLAFIRRADGEGSPALGKEIFLNNELHENARAVPMGNEAMTDRMP